MTDEPVRMNRWSLRFADAQVEASFAEEQARKSVRPLRIALAWLAGMMLVISPAIVHIAPHVRQDMPRGMSAFLGVLGAFYAMTYTPLFLRRHQWVMLIMACLISLGDVRLVSTQYTEAMLVASGFIILVLQTFTIYGVFQLRFPAATAAGWFSMALYLGLLSASGSLPESSFVRHAVVLAASNVLGMLIRYQTDVAIRQTFVAMRSVDQERARSDRLLLNILPAQIAQRLKASSAAIADHSADVTVLFADIVGFTRMSAAMSPQDLVRLLDRVFSEFDALAEKHGLEKIKTIGDAYMAAAGLPEPRADHAPAAARMAREMLAAVALVAAETGEALALRIGIHSGPVVAGVIGRNKFSYDMWGDTVNTASRMESHGVAGAIQCSEATAALLQPFFPLQSRGAVQVDGKGMMRTFLLGA